MAMLNFNPPIFTAQPPSHDRNALMPTVPIPSFVGRLVSPPPRPLSLASRRRRDSHVPNIFRDLRRRGNASVSPEVSRIHDDDVEVVDSDYDDDDDVGGDEDDDEDEDEDEDEEEIGDDVFVLGLGSRMQKWFENKPSGFGEGKIYDTSIEDKLLEEMQQSQIAQAANINMLKLLGKSGDNAAGKKLKKKKKNEVSVEEEDEVVPTGVQVRVGNLPKKKNIHRDLNLAFKGFTGISTIVPAVAGNKKTRDPICLGFAHVYLDTEEHALRFVRTFSGQTLTFGRVQKQIKCAMTNPHTEISAQETIDGDPEVDSHLALPMVEEYPFMSSQLEEDDIVEVEFQLMGENSEYFAVSDSEDTEAERKPISLSSSSDSQKKATRAMKPRAKSRPSTNKAPGKGKSGKIPKLEVPGSAKRLKIREKALLSGVLSKYQAMAASATTSDG